jgi:hypothetical protein
MPALDSHSTNIDDDALFSRFHRLMQDVERGECRRNSFEQWEIDILLDLRECACRRPVTRTLLNRYQKAARRLILKGARRPPTLSEYLERNARRAEVR